MNDLEHLWNLPHIQAIIAVQIAYDAGKSIFLCYDKEGCAIYRTPKDILVEEWKTIFWSITLGGHTFQGTFDRLDYSQRYIGYLEHDEAFAALEIIVPLAEPFQFLNTPIDKASIDLKDARGWPVYLTLYGKEMHITAHPATFTPIEEKE